MVLIMIILRLRILNTPLEKNYNFAYSEFMPSEYEGQFDSFKDSMCLGPVYATLLTKSAKKIGFLKINFFFTLLGSSVGTNK
jgi:hypothetical protein